MLRILSDSLTLATGLRQVGGLGGRLRHHCKFGFLLLHFIRFRLFLETVEEYAVEGESERGKRPFAHGRFQFAFPDCYGVPAHVCQLPLHFSVAFLIARYLLRPEVRVALWHYELFAAIVTMPETTVHEHASPVFPQHDIRFPWQSRMVKPISKTACPQIFAHNDLRLRVLRTNGSHHSVALFLCKFVWHGNSFLSGGDDNNMPTAIFVIWYNVFLFATLLYQLL